MLSLSFTTLDTVTVHLSRLRLLIRFFFCFFFHLSQELHEAVENVGVVPDVQLVELLAILRQLRVYVRVDL